VKIQGPYINAYMRQIFQIRTKPVCMFGGARRVVNLTTLAL
jgi:hypothetical protein